MADRRHVPARGRASFSVCAGFLAVFVFPAGRLPAQDESSPAASPGSGLVREALFDDLYRPPVPLSPGGEAVLFGGGDGLSSWSSGGGGPGVYEKARRQKALVGGSFEHDSDYSWFPDGTGGEWSRYDRLRLKLEGTVPGVGVLRVEGEFEWMGGVEREPVFDPLIEPPGNLLYLADVKADMLRFAFDFGADGWRAVTGRQEVEWGSGWLFNPTNLFRYKDVSDPDEEVDGSDGVRAGWGLGGDWYVDAFVGREPETGRERGGVRVSWTGPGFGRNLSLVGAFDREKMVRLIGFDASLERPFQGLGLFAEGAWVECSDPAAPASYARLEAGVEKVLPGGWRMTVEYYYDGGGVPPGEYTAPMYYDLSAGRRQVLGRHYAVAVVERGGGGGTAFFRIHTVTNLEDGGGLIVPEVTWRPFPRGEWGDVSVKLGGVFVSGPPGSEFRPEYLQGIYDWLGRDSVYFRVKAEF